MAANDALTVGEDWISEHYLASDAKGTFRTRVLERRKEWDDTAKEGHATPRSRFIESRQELLRILAGLEELSDAAHATALAELDSILLTAWGYDGVGLLTEITGPVRRISAPGLRDGAPLAVVSANVVEDVDVLLSRHAPTLRSPFVTDDGEELTSAARVLSHLFVAEDGPEFALVLAGPIALVAEATRWAEGRYLAVDLQVVLERAADERGGETDRALTCVAAQSLAPDAEGTIWWHGVLEESVKHTVGVSKDLREGVRESIEIIANEVVDRRRARGLDPLPADEAQPLARQSLRFLYRILFLLYAEASPELGVLPAGDDAYERGYSLDRLRELTLVELADQKDLDGTHLYDSLALLFRLVDRGTPGAGLAQANDVDGATNPDEDADAVPEFPALAFHSLRADLFLPRATAHIDAVGLGNGALQEVLRRLLLSKESRGRERGFISYAELGINQLGAVYEGLMSYTGFFATEDLYEVAKGGDGEKGSWVVPVTRAEGISSNDFVRKADPVTGERTPVLHEQGSFVFRLSGRERQQSASYYTPEVLTRFTVSQALAELLDQPDHDGTERTTTAREILDLTVCEPALGSGAFAIEAVRQLAAEYLRRRQDELGERIDPDAYPRELQKVKAYLALHQTYGVDLNETAVEFAEISLWLDTMSKGLAAPWFGLHLRRGNSLIGARHAFYGVHQLAKKAWLTAVPTDVPLTAGFGSDGRIHHFLLPAAGWGSASEAKEAKELAPVAQKRLKDWRRQVVAAPTKAQAATLVGLGHRVEALWDLAHRRLQIAEQEIRRSIGVWGADDLPVGGAVSREQIEEALADAKGAYQRLRLVMDAWCALWFWPLTDEAATVTTTDGEMRGVEPPAFAEWLSGLTAVLGTHVEAKVTGSGRNWRGGDTFLTADATWKGLGHADEEDRTYAGAVSIDTAVAKYPWLQVAQRIAKQQGFFHWELDFAPVFGGRGGFDLQVGNPPWVRPRSDVAALLAEGDPWWHLRGKATQEQVESRRLATLDLPGLRPLVVDGTAETTVTSTFVGNESLYPSLAGLQPDLYRCFMEQAWRHVSPRGVAALIHPESHFTDERAGSFRESVYARLRRHWQFVNSLLLFEIKDNKRFGVNVYGPARSSCSFLSATSVYHPDMIDRSFLHDGSGPVPGLRNAQNKWDLSPHRERLIKVTPATLRAWAQVRQDDNLSGPRMVYTANTAIDQVVAKLQGLAAVRDLGPKYSAGWVEGRDNLGGGPIDVDWGAQPWARAVLQGPFFHSGQNFYRHPRSTMANNQDTENYDLESLGAGSLPVTSFVVKEKSSLVDYDFWDGFGSASNSYRVGWRAMADQAGRRTLMPGLIPPGATHVDGVLSLGFEELETTVFVAACLSSLVSDLLVRVTPKSTIRRNVVDGLPVVGDVRVRRALSLRLIRLNCLTEAFSALWSECYGSDFRADSWTGLPNRSGWVDLGDVGPEWNEGTPLRRDEDRRQALLEIDALVALSLGLTADELCIIYRTQFPVLYGYDRNRDHYDANGRIVPNAVLTTWRQRGGNEGRYSDEDLSAVHPGSGVEYHYELPFETLDREAHMREAYAEFERRLNA